MNVFLIAMLIGQILFVGFLLFLTIQSSKKESLQLNLAIEHINSVKDKILLRFTLLSNESHEFEFTNPIAYINKDGEFIIHDRKNVTFSVPVKFLKNIQVKGQ